MKRKIVIALFALACLCPAVARAEWVKRNTNSFAWFKDIYFFNEQRGWITGTDGVLLETQDGGTTWIQGKKFSSDTFLQVHFTSENDGWMLCERNVFQRGSDPNSYLRRTRDGGRTWEKVQFEDGGRERVTRLLFNPDGVGMAFGEGGVFYKLQEDGATWKRSQTAIHYLLLDGAYGSEKVGAIVGTGGTIMFTDDGGFTWERASLLGDAAARFSSVFFVGQQGAWAVGSKGRIFRSNGGARLWRQQESGVTADLTDVYFSTQYNGWAIGENGVIVRTRDGGSSWTDVDTRTTHRLERIVFNGGRGWVVGFGGTVLTYDSQGGSGDQSPKPILMKRS